MRGLPWRWLAPLVLVAILVALYAPGVDSAINPGKVSVNDATLATTASVQTTTPSSGTAGLVIRWPFGEGASAPVRIDPTGTTSQPTKPDGSAWTLTGTSANMNVTNAATAGNGTVDGNTPRITIASDSTGQVKLAAGTADVGNVNLNKLNGNTIDLGAGNTSTGTQRIVPGAIAGLGRAAPLLISSSGDTVLVAGVSSQSTKVLWFDVFCNGANNVTLKSGTTGSPTTLWPQHNFSASTGVLLEEKSSRGALFTTRSNSTATDNDLVINLSAGTGCAVTLDYVQS